MTKYPGMTFEQIGRLTWAQLFHLIVESADRGAVAEGSAAEAAQAQEHLATVRKLWIDSVLQTS